MSAATSASRYSSAGFLGQPGTDGSSHGPPEKLPAELFRMNTLTPHMLLLSSIHKCLHTDRQHLSVIRATGRAERGIGFSEAEPDRPEARLSVAAIRRYHRSITFGVDLAVEL